MKGSADSGPVLSDLANAALDAVYARKSRATSKALGRRASRGDAEAHRQRGLARLKAATGGGPAQATKTLIYMIFAEGFQGLDIGSSGAQSVVLMAIVVALTVVQFRFIERRVQYS